MSDSNSLLGGNGCLLGVIQSVSELSWIVIEGLTEVFWQFIYTTIHFSKYTGFVYYNYLFYYSKFKYIILWFIIDWTKELNIDIGGTCILQYFV